MSELATGELALRDVWMGYGGQPVLVGIDLEVKTGSFTAILGSSGSGKTTLLRLVAGFERLERGEIRLGGRVVDDGHHFVPPQRRRLGFVPQDGALFPHLTVAANIGFGLAHRRRHQGRGHRAGLPPKTGNHLADVIDLVGLRGLEGRYPHQLSGGQQQRVALARALAIEPELILLDEPFSSLDAAMRSTVRADVHDILRKAGTTTVLVTHDQDEALSLADRVAVLRDGRIVQYGTPRELYGNPADADLARFLGEANLIPAVALGATVRTPLGALPLQTQDGAPAAGTAVTVLLRPEQIDVSSVSGPPGTGFFGRVVECSYYGHDAMLRIEPDPGSGVDALLVRVTGSEGLSVGAVVTVTAHGAVRAWAEPLLAEPLLAEPLPLEPPPA